jgi:hypothetical protein
MIRYSCDRCKRDIKQGSELRFVLKMEIEAQLDITDETRQSEDDHDHLSDIDAMLDNQNDYEEFSPCEFFQRRTFDLCSDCYRLVAKNPLGKESQVPFGFSNN